MIEYIKTIFVKNIAVMEIMILFLTLVTLKLPISTSGIFLPLSILVLIRNRKDLKIDEELKKIFIYFGLFLLMFTFMSIDIKLSVKGLYDIFRAFLIFFVTILLIKKLEVKDIRIFLLFVALLLLLGNFLFDRGRFYGYAINENNVAMEVFIVTIVGLICFNIKSKLNIVILVLFVSSSLILIFDAGSRGVILGLIFSLLVFINIYFKSKKFVILQFFIIVSSIIYLFKFNRGFSLTTREKIWLPLFDDTVSNNFFLGSGLNTIKLVIKELESKTETAHNLFLEIFVSSGILGLLIFIFLSMLLFKFYYKQKYNKTHIYYIGIIGLSAIFVMYQVDLKFTSYPFLGMVFCFLALIYSQKIEKKDIQ